MDETTVGAGAVDDACAGWLGRTKLMGAGSSASSPICPIASRLSSESASFPARAFSPLAAPAFGAPAPGSSEAAMAWAIEPSGVDTGVTTGVCRGVADGAADCRAAFLSGAERTAAVASSRKGARGPTSGAAPASGERSGGGQRTGTEMAKAGGGALGD